MAACAAAAVVVLSVFFVTRALGRPDEAFELEIDPSGIQLWESSEVTATAILNETSYAAAVETSTSVSLEPTPFVDFISNGTDINDAESYDYLYSVETVDRFFEINARAARDREFQRREVQVLSCCFAKNENDSCDSACLNHFVASVDRGSAGGNGTTPLLLCSALYELLECDSDHDHEYAAECMEYCRCFSSDPWVEVVWGAMSALFFVCMLLTLAVYACVPRLRNLHGKCLISYLVAVIAGEAVATVSVSLVCGQPGPAAAGVVHYFMLARCCWVNLLCFDVYCTCQPFQSVRQQPRTGSFSKERRKFLCFSAIAWAGPAVLFGLLKTFELESTTPIIYTGIIFFLLGSSCIPLILTLARIWRTRRQTKKKCLNISKMKLNWFYLTSKLLCLSGVGRLLSVVLYFTVRGKPFYNWLFVVLKLEGPIMLFLFVWNVRVRGLVRERLSTLDWISVERSNNV